MASGNDPNKTPSEKVAEPLCPKCGRQMRVARTTPVLFAQDVDRIVYVCDKCNTEEYRTIKRTKE